MKASKRATGQRWRAALDTDGARPPQCLPSSFDCLARLTTAASSAALVSPASIPPKAGHHLSRRPLSGVGCAQSSLRCPRNRSRRSCWRYSLSQTGVIWAQFWRVTELQKAVVEPDVERAKRMSLHGLSSDTAARRSC